MGHPRTLTATLAALILAASLTACNNQDDPQAAPTPSLDVEAAQAGHGRATAAADDATSGAAREESTLEAQAAPEAAIEAIRAYETAMRNQDSSSTQDPNAWIAEVAPHTTQDISTATRSTEDLGRMWHEAHQPGADYNINYRIIGCSIAPQINTPEGATPIDCIITTQVVDSAGNPHDPASLPPSWAGSNFTGDLIYNMAQDGGAWKVVSVDLSSIGKTSHGF